MKVIVLIIFLVKQHGALLGNHLNYVMHIINMIKYENVPRQTRFKLGMVNAVLTLKMESNGHV